MFRISTNHRHSVIGSLRNASHCLCWHLLYPLKLKSIHNQKKNSWTCSSSFWLCYSKVHGSILWRTQRNATEPCQPSFLHVLQRASPDCWWIHAVPLWPHWQTLSRLHWWYFNCWFGALSSKSHCSNESSDGQSLAPLDYLHEWSTFIVRLGVGCKTSWRHWLRLLYF